MSSSPMAVVSDESSAAALILQAAKMVPLAHYLIAFAIFIYCFLECHLIDDILGGFRGNPVKLTFNPASEIYHKIVSNCPTLMGRYLPTFWLSSPHLQTAFLNFYGRPPVVNYRRQRYTLSDGGKIALDWFFASAGGSLSTSRVLSGDDTTIVVLVPGLTSDSAASYMKHCVHGIAKQGWNVVICNHRGLAGMAVTSDCFYNAGWTSDFREVINYLHHKYPEAPLLAVGMSIGANILVKYLGEEGENTPISGAASVCSPYDLLLSDRFINRKLIQQFYDRALTTGLRDYAKLHESTLSRLANWEGITKSHFLREFDNHATCHLARYETVDTFYRCSSCVSLIHNVAVPLLCISALDDPVCTKEAIPWDECRENKNIVLATTSHGGHLAYFQGLTASSLWWVQAVREFLSILNSTTLKHVQKKTEVHGLHTSLASSIDNGPCINVMEDGMVVALNKSPQDYNKRDLNGEGPQVAKPYNEVQLVNQNENGKAVHTTAQSTDSSSHTGCKAEEQSSAKAMREITAPIKKSLNQLSRHYGKSIWLLAYIAIVTSWPLFGSVLSYIFAKKHKGVLPAAKIRR